MQEYTPPLAVVLGVPNVLLGPISLGTFCLLGRDTGFCRNLPFAIQGANERDPNAPDPNLLELT